MQRKIGGCRISEFAIKNRFCFVLRSRGVHQMGVLALVILLNFDDVKHVKTNLLMLLQRQDRKLDNYLRQWLHV